MRHDPAVSGPAIGPQIGPHWSDRELWSVAALPSGGPSARKDQPDPNGREGTVYPVPVSTDSRPPGASLLTSISLTRAQAAVLRSHYLDEVIVLARRMEDTLRMHGVPTVSWSVIGVEDLMRAWAAAADTIPLASVHDRTASTADDLGFKAIYICLVRSSGTLAVWDPRRILAEDVRLAPDPPPDH